MNRLGEYGCVEDEQIVSVVVCVRVWSLGTEPNRSCKRTHTSQTNDVISSLHPSLQMSSIPGVNFTTGGGNGMTPESAWSHKGMLKKVDGVNANGGDMMITPMMRLGPFPFLSFPFLSFPFRSLRSTCCTHRPTAFCPFLSPGPDLLTLLSSGSV